MLLSGLYSDRPFLPPREDEFARAGFSTSPFFGGDDDRRTPPATEESSDDEPLPLWLMKITQSAHAELMEYLLERKPEAAGILLGPSADDVLVTHFVPDRQGHGTAASFRLHTLTLNRELKKAKVARLNCKGIIHSHPVGIPQPSQGDRAYLESLFQLPANGAALQFFMPIVCGGRLYPYVYARGRVWPAELMLV